MSLLLVAKIWGARLKCNEFRGVGKWDGVVGRRDNSSPQVASSITGWSFECATVKDRHSVVCVSWTGRPWYPLPVIPATSPGNRGI